jgi:hypothetical protein
MLGLCSQQFQNTRRSDTLVVYGSGSSINAITDDQWSRLNGFDSIGFNWFLLSARPTTFYLIREQAIFGQRGRETRENLLTSMKQDYFDSTLIVSNLRTSSQKWSRGYDWAKYNRGFPHRGVIVNETAAEHLWNKTTDRERKLCEGMAARDPLVQGLLYDFCTMSSVLHLARFLRYPRILFAGVDLYDHRYFWLPHHELRAETEMKGRALDKRHHVARFTIAMIEQHSLMFPHVRLEVVNPLSLLASVIPVWRHNE